MFLQHPHEELAGSLKEAGQKMQEREDDLKSKFVYFEKQRSEAETNLKEMMTALQAQMMAAGASGA